MTIKYPSLTDREFLSRYLDFINLRLPIEQKIMPSEVDLMIEFALLPDKFRYQRFGLLAKNKVAEAASRDGRKLTKLNINNKIYALLDKNFLRRDEDKVIYLPDHFLKALEVFRKNKEFKIELNFTREANQDRSDTAKSE